MTPRTWYKWIFFGLFLTGFLYLLQKAFDFGIRHNLNLKAAYVATHKINAELLVLGPCEPLWMVSPQQITRKTGLSCYNLAESHSDFADNYAHLRLYAQTNGWPKYLLLYVTPESFDPRYNTFHTYRFTPFCNLNEVNQAVADCDTDYYKLRHFPFLQYSYYAHQSVFLALQGWKHYFTAREKPYYPDGFEPPAKMVWDNHHDNLKKAYPKGYSFSWAPLREKYFRAILNDCAKNGTKVILYESPILKDTRDYQLNREACIERIKVVAGNIPYLQFENTGWQRNRKYFISPMVTTLEGSYLFSDTLAAALDKKIVK